jgi:hypothetical protein
MFRHAYEVILPVVLFGLVSALGTNAPGSTTVEIQINALALDAEPDVSSDDYITWAPTFCRARLVDGSGDVAVVLSNDAPAYHLIVGGANLSRGTLEIGDRFLCRVDGKELKVDATSSSPTAIAAQIAAAWTASTVPELDRFDAVAVGTDVVITAQQADDASDVSVETVESDGQPSDGQTFLKSTKGDVKFAEFQDPWPVDTTATKDSVTLTLKGDGTWQPFVIAGRFGRPSYSDKDAVIVAHKSSVTGDVLGNKALMVRVRKNANRMGNQERDRFLQAMKTFRNKPTGGFLTFQELHRLATTASDEAHHQPAFFPWHRAMLLQVERELQAFDPSVTRPYWDWDAAAPNIFSEEFMGAPGTGALATPIFAAGHAFIGWSTDLPFSGGAIMRSTGDHAVDPASVGFPFLPLVPDLVSFNDYSQANIEITDTVAQSNSFSVAGERLSHDLGHAWACTSGHLTRPMRSACDPLFYFLHCQVDRQWAYWQRAKNRFGIVSGGTLQFPHPTHYDNQNAFDTPGNSPAPTINTDHTRQKGSYLDDGMWPWDGTSGGTPLTVATRPVNQEPPREMGTAQDGSNIIINGTTVGTITLRTGASSHDGYYDTYAVAVNGGTGSGQARTIVAYLGSARRAFVLPEWTTPPDATSSYVIDSENIPSSEPLIPMTAFPQSTTKNLWPPAPTIPKVRHMIDYLGRFKPSDGLGFCYEDVPYEVP